MSVPISSVPALIDRQAARLGAKPFLLCPTTGQTITYQQLATVVEEAAARLAARGVRSGDIASMLLPNVPAFHAVCFGAMRLGAIANPLNVHLTPAELAPLIDHAESKVLVTTASLHAHAAAAIFGIRRPPALLVVDETIPLPSQSAGHWDALTTQAPVDRSPDDVALLVYSSGTTGRPKGVLLTHRNLIADAWYIAEGHGFTEHDRALCILPLFHVNGFVVTTMTPLLIGASVVLPDRFHASTFWETIARYRVTWFSAVPTIYAILLNTPTDLRGLDCSALRFGMSAAAPLPRAVHEAFEARFGCPIVEGYGLSEATDHSTCNPPPPGRRKLGSIGRPIGNEMRVVDEHNRPVPVGVEGEIVIRGENVMKGYLKDPAATAEAIDAAGWLHTGDLGYVDADGYFFITGRKKELINRGGEKISPREIDEVLFQHPAVHDAATVGIPDPLYGEEVKAYVVRRPKHDVTPEEILAFCRARLAAFKVPKTVEFIAEIPRSPSGKVLRRRLVELHLATASR